MTTNRAWREHIAPRPPIRTWRDFLLAWLQRFLLMTLVAVVVLYPAFNDWYAEHGHHHHEHPVTPIVMTPVPTPVP
jgi:hypothetical protein